MITEIIQFSLKHKLLIILGSIGIVAAGILSLSKLPIDAFPDISPNLVQVFAELEGMAAEAGRYSLPDMPKAQLQALLQAEVTAADRGVNDVIRLLATERSMLLCDSDLYRQLVRRLFEAIAQMTRMEERLADEFVGSGKQENKKNEKIARIFWR